MEPITGTAEEPKEEMTSVGVQPQESIQPTASKLKPSMPNDCVSPGDFGQMENGIPLILSYAAKSLMTEL